MSRELESSKTITFKHTLDLNSASINVILTIPKTPNKKVPISLFISDQPSDVALEAYLYTISRDRQSFQTILNQSSSQDLMDLASKLSRAICLKYELPVYLGLSGSYDAFEYLGLIKLVIEYVQEKINGQS